MPVNCTTLPYRINLRVIPYDSFGTLEQRKSSGLSRASAFRLYTPSLRIWTKVEQRMMTIRSAEVIRSCREASLDSFKAVRTGEPRLLRLIPIHPHRSPADRLDKTEFS